MRKILVTGGSGFIGTNLLKKLSLKSNIYLVSNFFSNTKFYKVKNVDYKKADLENLNECKLLCKDIDTIVMCAANSSGAAVMEKTPLVHLNPNIRMNINMLEAAYESGVKKFIFISSNTVYPQVDFAVKETDVNYEYFSKYYIVGWMKRFSEIVSEIYGSKIKNSSMVTINIRPGNLYGPHDKFDPEKSKVVPSLISKIVSGQNPLQVWGDGKDIKDFLYIEDLVDALEKIIFEYNEHNTFNIASGKGITIKQIIGLILKANDIKDCEIIYDKSMPTMIPKRLIDIDKARKILNFNPKISMEEGIYKTVNWYKNDYK